MFEYVSFKSPDVSQVFCLLCTSIIASNEGFDADIEHTEVVAKQGIISQYYRTYYTLVAGQYDVEQSCTVEGLTFSDYNSRYVNDYSRLYENKHGTDSFNKLTESEKFSQVFMYALLPTVTASVKAKLSERESAETIAKFEKQFKSDFLKRFYCLLDEFTILNSSEESLWRDLYDLAMNMPHVDIGLRKQVSAYDSVLFRASKYNLSSLIPYMRSKKLKFSDYKNELSIAGIIINSFKRYYIKSWRGEYAKIVSGASSMVVSEDDDVLFGSDLQDKMFSGQQVVDIKNFDKLMLVIDKGSALYDIKHNRYYNLIEWRQNKIKEELIARMKELPIASYFRTLNTEIGGNLTNYDISNLFGTGNQDKATRFKVLDSMISEAYNANVDSTIARSLIDKWFTTGLDNRDTEMTKNGRYPMTFRYKQDKDFYPINKNRFKELIQGVQALKVLENSILSMDYTFMSFPVYYAADNAVEDSNGQGKVLLTGVTLDDYLNQLTAVDKDIVIESDTDADEEMEEFGIVDNISLHASELMKIVHKEHFKGSISLGSLTDDELALNADRESDRELLCLLKDNGVVIKIPEEDKSTTIHDLIYNQLSDSMRDSVTTNVLSIPDYIRRVMDISEKKKSGDTASIDITGMFLSKMKYLSEAINKYCVFGRLTHGCSSEEVEEENFNNYTVSEQNNFLKVFDINCDYTDEETIKGNCSVIMYGKGVEISDSELEDLKESNYFTPSILFNFIRSKYIKSRNYLTAPGFLYQEKRVFEGGEVKYKKQASLLNIFLCNNVPRFKQVSNERYSIEPFLDICKTLNASCTKSLYTNMGDENNFFEPRIVCFGVNINVIIESIIIALQGIRDNLNNHDNMLLDTNSENAVNVKLIIKTLRALDTLNAPHTGTGAIKELKMFEDIYNNFFTAISSINSEIRENKNVISSFIFMDSMTGIVDGVDDVEERLLQYTEVTKVVHAIMSNDSIYCVVIGGKKYSLVHFLRLLDSVLSLDEKHTDDEYFVDSIPITSLEESEQEEIDNMVTAYVNNSEERFNNDVGESWLNRIREFCDMYNNRLSQTVINGINLNYERYAVNKHHLITFDNKVLHSYRTDNGRAYQLVATEYGLFKCMGSYVMPLDGEKDLKWLLH